MFLLYFEVFYDLLLNRRMATWNLFVLHNNETRGTERVTCIAHNTMSLARDRTKNALSGGEVTAQDGVAYYFLRKKSLPDLLLFRRFFQTDICLPVTAVFYYIRSNPCLVTKTQ